MARPTLTVVGGGAPEPDGEGLEAAARVHERMASALKDPDGLWWAVTVVDGEIAVAYFGGKLESAVLAEAIAADMKREAVGL